MSADCTPLEQARLAREIGEAGPLLEAAAYLEASTWVELAISMRQLNGRLSITPSRISFALVRHEAKTVRAPRARATRRHPGGPILGCMLIVSLIACRCAARTPPTRRTDP